jgi:hypothetical protein
VLSLRCNGVVKHGASCGGSDMIPYRKFSDIQWSEFRTSQPSNPSKAPKVGDEEANDARTLDGLGALGAPTADSQNQLERDAGITVVTDGPVVRNLLAGVRAAKPAKPAKDGQPCATGGCAEWSAEDWRVRFDQRAGFLKHDGGLVRAEAEFQAFNCCVVEWLNQHLAPSQSGRCAWCGTPESPDAVVVPFGTEPGTHAWLHAECWPAWYQRRREEAVLALRGMGITMGGDQDD